MARARWLSWCCRKAICACIAATCSGLAPTPAWPGIGIGMPPAGIVIGIIGICIPPAGGGAIIAIPPPAAGMAGGIGIGGTAAGPSAAWCGASEGSRARGTLSFEAARFFARFLEALLGMFWHARGSGGAVATSFLSRGCCWCARARKAPGEGKRAGLAVELALNWL